MTPHPTRSRPKAPAPSAGSRATRSWRQKITSLRLILRGNFAWLARHADLTLEHSALPFPERCRSLVGAGQKIHQGALGIICARDRAVGQDVFAEIVTIERLGGSNRRRSKAIRLGISIRIKGRVRHQIVAGPEACAADLVRIGLLRDSVWQIGHSTRMKRRPPAGKASDGKVETSPEEVNRAALADERGAELEEDAIDLREDAPMPLGKTTDVGRVARVVAETDRVGQLVGHIMDADFDSKIGEGPHDLGIEIADTPGLQ